MKKVNKGGLRINSIFPLAALKIEGQPIGDGIALTSASHPVGPKPTRKRKKHSKKKPDVSGLDYYKAITGDET